MTLEPPAREPVFNAPAVVIGAIVLMTAIHLARSVLPPSQDDDLLWTLAFIPARYVDMAGELPGPAWSSWVSPVSHMLLHANWPHLLINSAWLLAFGTIIARRMSGLRFVAFALACGLGGAALFAWINWGEVAPMVGASGAVSGLMGGVFRFLAHAREHGGIGGMRSEPRTVPLMPLWLALTNRRVVTMVAAWLGINAVFATDFGRSLAGGDVAWEAHVGGFLVGFFLIGLFDTTRRAPQRAYEPANDPAD